MELSKTAWAKRPSQLPHLIAARRYFVCNFDLLRFYTGVGADGAVENRVGKTTLGPSAQLPHCLAAHRLSFGVVISQFYNNVGADGTVEKRLGKT